ncbi:MAG: 3-deoxy-D-manno-octulosonic acid transferase [Ideonella sp.]
MMQPDAGSIAAWRRRLALRCYGLLMWLLIAPMLLRMVWRGRSEALYRHAIVERLGRYAPAIAARIEPGRLWLHAVSLGETRAAAALLQALRERSPGLRVLLTHGTATGREAGQALLQPGDLQVWMPWDSAAAVRRFLARHRPCIGVLMETEVWPAMQHAAAASGLPMVLANARLSAASLHRQQIWPALMRPAMQGFDTVLAQSSGDAQRLRDAGAGHVVICGNLKFDMTPDPELLAQGRQWRRALGRPVAMAASTREGEEAPLLAAWQAACRPDAATLAARPLLLLVPRHPQRFDEVAAMCQAAGLKLARRSAWGDAQSPPLHAADADAWLGDSLGELPMYYALADVALLGGSFAPLGGQNLIEAAACGCPILIGPSSFNFAEAAELAIAAGAALRVADLTTAVETALGLLGSERERLSRSDSARAFAAEHRGAAAKMAAAVVARMAAGAVAAEGLSD